MLRSVAHKISLYARCYVIRVAILLCLIPAAGTISLHAQDNKGATVLEPAKPIERELAGDAAHSFSILLAADQFLHVVVEQKGIDVVVTLFAPNGKTVMEVDSPNGSQGPEPIFIIAETAGNYRLEVRSLDKNAAAGHYVARIEELRTAMPQDKSRIAAQQGLTEAALLESEGSVGSRLKAIDKYVAVLPLLRKANERSIEADTLNNIGYLYDTLSEKQKALDYYNQALTLRREVGDRNGEAVTLNNIGWVFVSQSESKKALDYLNKALTLMRATGDKSGEAAALTNIGAAYKSMGEPQKALDYFNQALPLMRVAGNRSGEAASLMSIGLAYYTVGENQKSLDYLNKALTLRRELGDRQGEAELLTNIGGLYIILGETQKGLDYYKQALPLRRAVGDRYGESATLNGMGVVYYSLGEWQKALDFYNQALAIRRAIDQRGGVGSTLHNIGKLYVSMGQKQKALDYFNQALTLFREVESRYGEANVLSSIGEVYNSLGENKKSLDYLTQALPLRRAVGDRSGEAETLAHIAIVERDQGNLSKARTRIEEALNIIESLRAKLVSKELRSSYFATVQKYYEFYIDLLMRMHAEKPSSGYDGAALQASERGRARSLLETLAEANSDIRQGVDPKLVARERSLQLQLNAKAQTQMALLRGRNTAAQAEVIAKEIDELTTEYQQIEAEIRQSSPNYAALTQPQPLSLEEIQTQVLDKNTLLLEYSLGAERSYVWAVTPTDITSHELPKREVIEATAKRLYELINARNKSVESESQERRTERIAQADAEIPIVSLQLSQMILSPVAARLGHKRLLIVLDGALQYIPFSALPEPAQPGEEQAVQPVVVRHEIVSLPSASTLAVLRREMKGRKPAPKAIMALADPVFAGDDERIQITRARQAAPDTAMGTAGSKKAQATNGQAQLTSNDTETNISRLVVQDEVGKSGKETGLIGNELRLARLPGTRREAEQLMALAPVGQRQLALDFRANRAMATGTELSQYRYIHFATHGFLNSVHPELSGLVLSLVDEQGNPQDGFLRAHEVFNLRLLADLVVLSACQTGLGKEIKGEGLVSLTRGFMYAGSPRVVVSLWSVSDAATAELMVRFYRGMLKAGMRPAAALRAAQISLMKETRWQSPFYWAAFTLQGEWK